MIGQLTALVESVQKVCTMSAEEELAMRFILRREEQHPENFLLWQTKCGRVVAWKETILTAGFLLLWLVWLVVTSLFNSVLTFVVGASLWAVFFLVYNHRCSMLPSKRPTR